MLVLPLPSLRAKRGNKRKKNNKKRHKQQAKKDKVDEKLKFYYKQKGH
jgi:hypothetical protein